MENPQTFRVNLEIEFKKPVIISNGDYNFPLDTNVICFLKEGETVLGELVPNNDTDKVGTPTHWDEVVYYVELNNIDEAFQLKELLSATQRTMTDIKQRPHDVFLHNKNLTCLPDGVCDLEGLRNLGVTNNNIETLPEEMGLKDLTSLNLQRNKIKKLPDSIGDINNLEDLNLSNNVLEVLPESIGNLKQLTDLDLGHNKLVKIPKSIGYLESLVYLDLCGNPLTTLPDSIKNLHKLENLYLEHTNISNDELIRIKKMLPSVHVHF